MASAPSQPLSSHWRPASAMGSNGSVRVGEGTSASVVARVSEVGMTEGRKSKYSVARGRSDTPHSPSTPFASSPPPACSTATTPRSTSCGGSCSPRAARSSTSATTARSHEVVTAVVQEDVQGVAVSSYQGGHNEYFRYLVDELRARGAGHVTDLRRGRRRDRRRARSPRSQAYGVARIFSPEDGQRLGLARDDQHDRRARATSIPSPPRSSRSTTCSPATRARSPAPSPPSSSDASTPRC